MQVWARRRINMTCKQSVNRRFLVSDATGTNLMEAHAWFSMPAEARSSCAGMAEGTLAKPTVVPVVLAVSGGSCLVIDSRTANQTHVHRSRPTYWSAWESSHLNSKLLTIMYFGMRFSS